MSNFTLWKPAVLLRTASVLMVVHFAGHTMGMMQGASHGREEVAVQDAMKAYRFDAMGSMRSYWDFFLGFGYDASLSLLLQAVLLWLLAGTAKKDPVAARPFIGVFACVWAATVFLYVKYFFVAPVVLAVLMVMVLGAALGMTYKRE